MFRFFLAVVIYIFMSFPAYAQPLTLDIDAFKKWQASFEKEALLKGIPQSLLNKAFDNLSPDESVLKAAQNQAEFKRAIWDYLDRAVSATRVERGKEKYRLLEEDLSKIYEMYGVEPEVLVAIWGLESSYGAILDNDAIVKNVVRSLSTLAAFDKRRARFAKTQLLAVFNILQSGDIELSKMTGSWAGAMGHTQFIPTTYLQFAVDYDGDGKRNIWQSELDALASAANYLNESGWQKGLPWGVEVSLPETFDYSLARRNNKKTVEEWSLLGVKPITQEKAFAESTTAYLYLPSGYQGPSFLLFKNFDVIKRYNNANAYALAIGAIANKIKDEPAITTKWPRYLKTLDTIGVKKVQKRLTDLGFDAGGVDGLVGPKTQSAVRAFQKSKKLVADGFLSQELLELLRVE